MYQEKIRNFAIISHIDHGKSTLADRFLEYTKTVDPRKMRERFLDKLPQERKRGVTIKLQAIQMLYRGFTLNLIDTPGHTDFSYEVSRALAACEGALCLVDASQGIQAQTLSNVNKAKDLNLSLIPVINKVDLRNAQIEQTEREFIESLGFNREEIYYTSGKTGEGVPELLQEIVRKVPPPSGMVTSPLRALVFDSFYSDHRGVVAYIKIIDGTLAKNNRILFMGSHISGRPLEIGVIKEDFKTVTSLSVGEVGYIATGFKDLTKCRVGDTITTTEKGAKLPLPGYKKVKPMVFASIFPSLSGDYQEFLHALEKLALNDAALEYSLESSPALGFGFRVGFLGTFHAEITKERLEQEFGQDVIITTPSVNYKFSSSEIKEPWMSVTIITPENYVSKISQLVKNHRGILLEVKELMSRLQMVCEIPLSEIIVDFHDELKSLSSGYASFDYKFLEYRVGEIVNLNIIINKEIVAPLSRWIIKSKAERTGREIVKSLKKILPRQLFAVPLQAAIGSKIIARETIPALRKDVTAKLYGGDRTRKDKLLKKQKKGKKKLAKFGKVEIPKDTYFKILKT